MSYSYDVKINLCTQKRLPCCRKSFWYGFLAAGNAFLPGFIRVLTEHNDILELFIKYINKEIPEIASVKDVLVKGNIKPIYELSLNKKQSEEIVKILAVSERSIVGHQIDFDLIKKECCVKSFISGVFVCVGFLSDPNKSYHLELVFHEKSFADDIVFALGTFDIKPKITVRNGDFVVYLKSSESILDFLNILSATTFCFDYMNAGIEKQIRNTVNRQINCDNANLDKTVSAAAQQLAAIKKLEKENFASLTPELAQIAILRQENPELSLAQLSELCDPPLSKSGVSHRLKKIIEKANEIN
ncbi:MAG: DNA-binding protein WhiA [Clostridiales bacterium]|nr:MAG: DNA-binding protein WhiA [Clostridiales bacterium]